VGALTVFTRADSISRLSIVGETRGGWLGSFSFPTSLQIVTNDAYVRWDSGRASNLVVMASSMETAIVFILSWCFSLMVFWWIEDSI